MNEIIPRVAGLTAAVGLPLLASLVAWLGGGGHLKRIEADALNLWAVSLQERHQEIVGQTNMHDLFGLSGISLN